MKDEGRDRSDGRNLHFVKELGDKARRRWSPVIFVKFARLMDVHWQREEGALAAAMRQCRRSTSGTTWRDGERCAGREVDRRRRRRVLDVLRRGREGVSGTAAMRRAAGGSLSVRLRRHEGGHLTRFPPNRHASCNTRRRLGDSSGTTNRKNPQEPCFHLREAVPRSSIDAASRTWRRSHRPLFGAPWRTREGRVRRWGGLRNKVGVFVRRAAAFFIHCAHEWYSHSCACSLDVPSMRQSPCSLMTSPRPRSIFEQVRDRAAAGPANLQRRLRPVLPVLLLEEPGGPEPVVAEPQAHGPRFGAHVPFGEAEPPHLGLVRADRDAQAQLRVRASRSRRSGRCSGARPRRSRSDREPRLHLGSFPPRLIARDGRVQPARPSARRRRGRTRRRGPRRSGRLIRSWGCRGSSPSVSVAPPASTTPLGARRDQAHRRHVGDLGVIPVEDVVDSELPVAVDDELLDAGDDLDVTGRDQVDAEPAGRARGSPRAAGPSGPWSRRRTRGSSSSCATSGRPCFDLSSSPL